MSTLASSVHASSAFAASMSDAGSLAPSASRSDVLHHARRSPARAGRWGAALLMLALLVPGAAVHAQDATITEEDVVKGAMDIQFRTRTTPDTSSDLKANSPALGVRDLYSFNLNVAKTTEFSGKIERQPNLYGRLLGSKKQDALLQYDVTLAVLNPNDLKQKLPVGKWVGVLPFDAATGAFNLAGGSAQDRPLRIVVDTRGKASGFEDKFAGRLVGKAEKKEGLASYTYRRIVGGKEVAVTVKRSDPMQFVDLRLAKGPAETYPATLVNGRLDYDYETGNYLTDGIVFKYALNGKDYEDRVTGTIKWVEDPDRKTNGKGHYEFNLRFNEDRNKPASGEAAAFETQSGEDAFFAVDNSIPCLTGRIEYVDTMVSGSDLPSASKVTYRLNANKLTKQQIMNFLKLWLVAVGPTNDE